eukprot:TRINITY_DN5483_c0_g1_i1.p1 TRINITY_DN5483_c0_g1~~TRINITY_DN5483_c0_g1_i1.p1  ORF type:complete len:481 (+),score=29.75 TRINITY_DN5483_c0_g1_i1:91-1533(+)
MANSQRQSQRSVAENCIRIPCPDAATQGRLSFLGPSLNHPEIQPYVDSPCVDLEVEYEYPRELGGQNLFVMFVVGSCWFFYLIPTSFLGDHGVLLAPILVAVVFFCLVSCCVCSSAYLRHFFSGPTATPMPLSRREFRHVIGTTGCTVFSWLYCGSGLLLNVMKDHFYKTGVFYTYGYMCVCLTSVIYVGMAWVISKAVVRGLPVKAGFVMSMFWTGAIYSIFLGGFLNSLYILAIWPNVDETCSITQQMVEGHGVPRDDVECFYTLWLEWIFTAGLNEETLKFMVLMRLRTSLEEIVSSCWLTKCLRSSTTPGVPMCAWFLKLAPTPCAVVLSGMAAGAGFATLENVDYVTKIQGLSDDPWMASIRLFSASIHICMTGTCAVAYAFELFLSPGAWMLKYLALGAMIFLHGTFNASTAWGGDVTLCVGIFINLQFFLWFVLTVAYIEPESLKRRAQTQTITRESELVDQGRTSAVRGTEV